MIWTTPQDYIKYLMNYPDYTISEGFGLSYEDFEKGKGTLPIQGKMVCISWDGFDPVDLAESSQWIQINEEFSLFIRTAGDDNARQIVLDMIKHLRDNNEFQVSNDDAIYHIQLLGVMPYTSDKNEHIFIINLTVL